MAFKSSKRRKHSKLGQTTLRAFHFRIETSAKEFAALHDALDLAHELRNTLATVLEDVRKEARQAKLRGDEPKYLGAYGLQEMVAADKLPKKFAALHSQVRQQISMCVTEGQARWFEAMKEGRRHVRPPGEIARKNFRSITYPQYGTAAKISGGKLHLSKLGEFRLIGWRKMRGRKKSVTIKFKEGHFWAIVMCECQERDVCRPFSAAKSLPEGGIDPGLSSVLTDSYGAGYETPEPLKKALAKLRHIQRDVSRKFEMRKKLHISHLAAVRERTGSKAPVVEGLTESLRKIPYSNRLKANIKKLAKAHTKVARVRADVAHKNARKIERKFARVAVEDHGLQFMLSNRKLSRKTADVAIGQQKFALLSAMGSGRYFLTPNRRPEGGNSQTCLCGASTPKTLKDRWHACPECGLEGPRDHVSAIIVQHTAFGSLPPLEADSQISNSKECMPGLGILEHAAKVLETRRGESKRGGGESRASRVSAKSVKPSEPRLKRTAPRDEGARKTAGEAKAASAKVKTTGHADLVSSCPVEAKGRAQKPSSPILSESAFERPTKEGPKNRALGSFRSTLL